MLYTPLYCTVLFFPFLVTKRSILGFSKGPPSHQRLSKVEWVTSPFKAPSILSRSIIPILERFDSVSRAYDHLRSSIFPFTTAIHRFCLEQYTIATCSSHGVAYRHTVYPTRQHVSQVYFTISMFAGAPRPPSNINPPTYIPRR